MTGRDEDSYDGAMSQRVDQVHHQSWEKYASIGSVSTIILPLLSEFEGVGEEVMVGIGGAGLASAFAILMKIGRVTSAVQGLREEQDQVHQEMEEAERKKRKQERERRKHSQFAHDPIGWTDDE